jgi:exosortase
VASSVSERLLRLGAIGAVALFLGPALAHAVEVWRTDEEFSYGFLILPVALAVVWLQRRTLRASVGRGSWWGLPLIGLAIALTLLSQRTDINVLGGLAVTPLLIGVALFLWGWRTARLLVFPSVYVLFGLALYRGLLSSLGFSLQEFTAVGAGSIAPLLGLAVDRDGLILRSTAAAPRTYAFVVAQACSGMSSLLSLLALTSLWIYSTRGSLASKAIVLLGVPPLVMLANTVRVTSVLAVANSLGQDAALGFFHGASSLVLFGLSLLGLLALGRLVGCRLPTPAISS